MYSLSPIQKIALYLLGLLGIIFCGCLGSWYLQQPAPIVYKQEKDSGSRYQKRIRRGAEEQEYLAKPVETPKKHIQKQIETLALVHIVGEVQRPGIYQVKLDARAHEVIDLAGGLTKSADKDKINLVQKVKDGMQILIPAKKPEKKIERQLSYQEKPIIQRQTQPLQEVSQSTEPVNINTADLATLAELPGIGEKMALKIIEYRESHEKFQTIEELKQIRGIGEKKLTKLRHYIKL
jgi:competence protein ComEA